MLPELILREEHHQNLPLLVFLGFLSGIAGFITASFLFPSQTALLSVVFASIPLVFPLVTFFLERETESRPHAPEMKVYGSIFIGMAAAFFSLALVRPEKFDLQEEVIGLVGQAIDPTFLAAILSNNLMVFFGILIVAAIIGSAGTFILTWNASVLGVFMAGLVQESIVMPLAYVPHTTLEILGFIVAGISGTMISAAVYREHFDRETWTDLGKLVVLGVVLIVVAAVIESG